MNDGFDSDIEPYFGLRKFDPSEVSDNMSVVVVWCTNDYVAQKVMKNKFDKMTVNYSGISLYSTSISDV